MKRSEELAPLSRDHHQALFVALQLKRGIPGSEAAFLGFIEGHGREHFRIEEEIVLPVWLAADSKADGRLAARIAAEHLEIRSCARRLRAGSFTDEARIELGVLLGHHIRFEERELFPLIEAGLGADRLAALGAEVAAAEAA